MCVYFKNIDELREYDNELAIKLLEERGQGDWQKYEITKHNDIEYFAEYELYDGWYSSLGLNTDFKGAPNPIQFINLKQLGESLANTWDNSVNFLSSSGEVLQTSYGW